MEPPLRRAWAWMLMLLCRACAAVYRCLRGGQRKPSVRRFNTFTAEEPDEPGSAEAVNVVGLASVAASEIEVVTSGHAPSKRNRRHHTRNRLGGSAGSNAPLLRDEDLDQLKKEVLQNENLAAGFHDLDEPVLLRHPSNQAEPGTPRVAHVAALVTDDASDVVASVLARPVPPDRDELDAEGEYTDVSTHGQEALPKQLALASQWAFDFLDELTDDVLQDPVALQVVPEAIIVAPAAAPAAQTDQPTAGGLPLSPVREDVEAGAPKQQHKPPPPQPSPQQPQETEDTLTVHLDLRDGAELGTPPLPAAKSVTLPQPATLASATLAPSTSAPRTALHGLAQAWLASLATGVDGADEIPDVVIERLFAAFDLSATVVGGAIGAVMAASVKNDNANMAVVRKALARRFTDESMQSLRALLSAEIAARVHKDGASGLVLRDPSCALSIVWLRRGLALQTGIIEGLVRERQQSMNTIVTNAYVAELEQYHNWALRGTMKLAFNAAPNKDRVLRNFQGKTPLSPGVDGYKGLYEDLAEVAEAQRRVMDAIAKPLVALDLDRGAAGA